MSVRLSECLSAFKHAAGLGVGWGGATLKVDETIGVFGRLMVSHHTSLTGCLEKVD